MSSQPIPSASASFRFRKLGDHLPQITVFHYIHRGERLVALLQGDCERTDYLRKVAELRSACGIQLYAYCLMSNHVHFLIGTTKPDSMRIFLRRLSSLHGESPRTPFPAHKGAGTKLVSITSMLHALKCMRYIELNPVNGGVVERPEEGSASYAARMGIADSEWLDEAPWYQALASTEDERQSHYRAFIARPRKLMELTLARLRSC